MGQTRQRRHVGNPNGLTKAEAKLNKAGATHGKPNGLTKAQATHGKSEWADQGRGDTWETQMD